MSEQELFFAKIAPGVGISVFKVAHYENVNNNNNNNNNN